MNIVREKGNGCKKRIFPGLILFLAAVVALAGCGEKVAPGTAQVKRPTVRGVSIMAVAPSLVDDLYDASGTVRAVNTSYVASRMMGTVTSLVVKEGDMVQAGQLLLTIDDRDVHERVKAAEAGYQEAVKAREAAQQSRALADITYQRYRKMYDEKAISLQEMDQFATQRQVSGLEYERTGETVNRAAAGLAEAKVYLGFTRVTAPHKGMVTEKKIEVGSMAMPGLPLLTVENTASYTAEISINEGLTGKLRVGTPVMVSVESLGQPRQGKISQVLPPVDSLSRTFTVKVSLSGAGLRSGLYARVTIPRGKKEVLLVPGAAIVEKGQLTGVYAVDTQSVITYRLVRVGRSYGDGNKEILSGLNRHDRIIVKGMEQAVDGGIVENKT